MMTNNTKARFNAERVEAGYKYLDSLRELMGVGQTVGEGPGLLPCPNPSCRSVKVRSGSSLYPFYIYCANCLMKGPREGSDNLGQRWNSLPRAPQPATAPGDLATVYHGVIRHLAKALGWSNAWPDPNDPSRWFLERPAKERGMIETITLQDAIAAKSPAPRRTVLDEIEVALISIADGVAPADAVQRAFDIINRERLATPTDVAERARRAFRALDDAGYIDKDMVQTRGSSDVGAVVADIVAAEFGGGSSRST